MKKVAYIILAWLGGILMCLNNAFLFLIGILIFGFFAYKFGVEMGMK